MVINGNDVPCEEHKHDFRNAVQCLEGWILELKKDNKINKFDKDLGMYYLKKLAICSKLDRI
jgi:hypothetical protein